MSLYVLLQYSDHVPDWHQPVFGLYAVVASLRRAVMNLYVLAHRFQLSCKAEEPATALTHFCLLSRCSHYDRLLLSHIERRLLPQLIKLGHLSQAAELGR